MALFCGLAALAACGGSALNESGSPVGPSTGGGTSAAAGSGSSGDGCSAPATPGPCDAYAPVFWHNAASGLCEPFVYGGCAGNDNRYATRDECLKACPGGGSDWGACQRDADCTLTSAECCGACDPVTDHDLLALNAAHLADYSASKPCASAGACLPCASVGETTATRKYFRAVCVAGQCSALDVRQSPLTACVDASDCSLRNGVACCQSCMEGFVAVNTSANFCPDGNDPCPKCAIALPDQALFAACVDGHCQLDETLK